MISHDYPIWVRAHQDGMDFIPNNMERVLCDDGEDTFVGFYSYTIGKWFKFYDEPVGAYEQVDAPEWFCVPQP